MAGTLILCGVVFLSLPAPKDSAMNWEAWRFLLGQWVAEGNGQPGRGAGSFSFNLDLNGRILVRKNRADYPATKDHPAFSHRDLMVVYRDAEGAPARAIYFDNEGHVIHYTANLSEDGTTLIFLSDHAASVPRYRLTYTKGKVGTLEVKFEIAPPGKPDSFSTYVEGVARRKEAR